MIMKEFALVFLVAVLLTGCSAPTGETNEAIDPKDTIVVEDVASTKSNLSAEKYDIKVSDEYILFNCASYADKIYYIECKPLPDSEGFKTANIVMYDNQERQIIHTINSEEHFTANELCVTKDRLFWVTIGPSSQSIQSLDLDKLSSSTIKQFDSLDPILLSSADDHVSWFEYVDISTSKVMVYECSSEDIIEIDTITTSQSLYTRAYINDGLVSYLDSSGGSDRIVIYDLVDKAVFKNVSAPDGMTASAVSANRNYTVWLDGDYGYLDENNALYVLDNNSDENKPKRIELSSSIVGLFSFHLMDNYLIIIINPDIASLQDSDLNGMDLGSGKQTTLLTGSFTMGQVEPDNVYQCVSRDDIIVRVSIVD